MKIRFTEYLYPEDWNFTKIIKDLGLADRVDGSEIETLIWEEGGTRELAVELVLDTETGIIEVAK